MKKFFRKLKESLQKVKLKSFLKENIVAILCILTLVFAVINNLKPHNNYISFSELIQKLEKNEVKAITLADKKAEVELNESAGNQKVVVNMPLDKEVFEKAIEEKIKKGEIVLEYKSNDWLDPELVVSTVLFILILNYFLLPMIRKSGSHKKSLHKGSKVKVTFKDVVGLDEEKQELSEMVEFLKNSRKYQKVKARLPKGVLLIGHPGTGKTLLAKAVSGEAGVPFFHISGSDFIELYVGVGASRVRDLFKDAKKNCPCIIFIDEIDSIGKSRIASSTGSDEEQHQTLNQLLVEMDGFDTSSGIVILAATNKPEILDQALLRPGRFDRHIRIGYPDIRAREEILKLYCTDKPLDPDIEFSLLAKNTVGFTGAALENIVNEAAILAVRKDKSTISMSDMKEAIIKVIMGPEKKSSITTETEKRLKAYHEGGHVVVSWFLPSRDPVYQVSIIPRGNAGGYTASGFKEHKEILTKSEMFDSIAVLLGGWVAEQLIFNDISTGAQDDLERSTEIVRQMVRKFGMSGLGPRNFEGDNAQISLKKVEEIDQEIDKIILDAITKVENLLKENVSKLKSIAEALLEKEKLESSEIKELMEKN